MDHSDKMCSHQVVAGTLYNFDIALKLKSDCARKMMMKIKKQIGYRLQLGTTINCHVELSEEPQQQRKMYWSCQDPGSGDNTAIPQFPRNDQHPDYYRYNQNYESPEDYQGNPFASEWSTLQVTDYDGGVAIYLT